MTMTWQASKEHRYERVYYPIHTEEIPVELVLAAIICAIDVANRLLVSAVGAYCYVARVEVRPLPSLTRMPPKHWDTPLTGCGLPACVTRGIRWWTTCLILMPLMI